MTLCIVWSRCFLPLRTAVMMEMSGFAGSVIFRIPFVLAPPDMVIIRGIVRQSNVANVAAPVILYAVVPSGYSVSLSLFS